MGLNLHILHTNDVHSELQSYARLARGMRHLRDEINQSPDPVLTFDLGDHIDLSNSLSEATSGRINADILKAMEYDGWVFGNNETVTVDQVVWPELIKRSGATLYCSNLHFSTSVPNLASGRLLSYPGVTIGVFGVTVFYENLLNSLEVPASDPLPIIWQVARELKSRGAHTVILLSHLGLHIDEQLAESGLPVDLIIGSHTHQFLESPLKCGRTWIVQAGKLAKAFGHTTLHFESHQLVNVTSRLVYTTPHTSPDAAVLQAMNSHSEQASAWLFDPVATLAAPLMHSLFGESHAVNVLCDQVRRECDVEIAILNGGVIGAGFRAGVVRRKDLSAACGTPMRPVIMNLMGEALWVLLDQALDMRVIAKQGFGFGFRSHYVGRLHVSGATLYTVMQEGDDGELIEKVSHIMMNGVPLEPDRIYRVAVSEFVALSSTYPATKGAAYQYFRQTLRAMYGRALADPEKVRLGAQRRYIQH